MHHRTRPPGVHLLWALCCLPAVVLHAQELPFTHYTTENEVNPLPSSGITAVHQDRLGYIWIAAYGSSLARYDGHTLRRYGYEDSLKTRSIWALAEDGNGRLWVGSDDGLFVSEKPLPAYVESDHVTFAASIGSVPLHSGSVYPEHSLAADRNGWIWFAPRGDHVMRYRIDGPGTIRADTIPLPPGIDEVHRRASPLIGRKDGSVWMGLKEGRLVVVDGDSTSVVDGVPCSATSAFFEAPSGTLWGGCHDGTIWSLTGEATPPRFDVLDASYAGLITSMLEDTSGTLWVGGLGGGLMGLAPDAPPVTYSRRQGLLDENVWDLMQDREGNYWIAQNNGLSKLRVDYEAFSQYTGTSHAGERPALPASDVDSVLPPLTVVPSAAGDSLTVLVAGTPGGAVLIRDDNAIEHLTTDQGLSSNLVLNLCTDGDRGIWIGTRDGANRLTFDDRAGVPPDAAAIRSLTLFERSARLARFDLDHVNACGALSIPPAEGDAPTREALCFAGTYRAHCLIDDRWFSFGPAAGLPEDDYWTLTADERGYVYVSTKTRGLYRSSRPLDVAFLEASSVQTQEPDAFPARDVTGPVFEAVPAAPASENVRNFSSLAWVDRTLWAAGDGIAVVEGDPPGLTTLMDQTHGFDANPESIAYAPHTKTIWVGTERGLVEIDPGTRSVIRWLTRQEGLVGNVVWGPDAVAVGADGTVYYATSTGLSLYRPHLDRKQMTAPAPRLSRVRFSENRNGYNELNLDYAALSFSNEKKVRFRTRLRGFEEDWSPEKTETSVRYTNLGAFLFPHTYTFEVVAANEDGLWSVTPLTYAVTAQPAWWLSWWAFLGYVTMATVVVVVLDRRQRRRLIQQERARSLLREKELRADAAEAWANYLQAENQRQTQELEQARRLQLSMLPEKVPDHPTVEIAAYMKTASEVGGDYYDFHLAGDGTLTLTIGDATGHGLLAGTMVTAMKSLWNAFSQDPDLKQVLRNSDTALKQMGLPRLYMALALGRLRTSTLELVGAGMPPALVYRAATSAVEEIPLKGMPLGGPGRLPYQSRSVTLAAGDTVVLMSDGFPELRGASGELIGYDRAAEMIAAVADRSATAIIAHLEETITSWCNGQRPDDDVTFLVLKMREPPPPSPTPT